MVADDPTVVHTIVVTAEDVVAALESNRRSGRDAVLRITPPFSGRMRARLHIEDEVEYEDEEPRPVHIDPNTLLASSAPDYPDPADTEDELRSDPDVTYTRERHHERHADAVDDWRRTVPDHVHETATIDTPAGAVDVDVAVLGETG